MCRTSKLGVFWTLVENQKNLFCFIFHFQYSNSFHRLWFLQHVFRKFKGGTVTSSSVRCYNQNQLYITSFSYSSARILRCRRRGGQDCSLFQYDAFTVFQGGELFTVYSVSSQKRYLCQGMLPAQQSYLPRKAVLFKLRFRETRLHKNYFHQACHCAN